MKYVTDAIGEDYKNWEPGSNIFISSPTGSGKTSFILNTYLPYLADKGQRILFLVNRTVLKEEIETKLCKLPFQYRHAIDIETYQSLESKLLNIHEHEFKADYERGYEAAVAQITESYEKRNIGEKLQSIRQYDNQLLDYYFRNYCCVVCDECHRYLNEATYDTATILSYNFIRKVFQYKIQIYMSATIKHMQKFIDEENKLQFFYKSEWLKVGAIYSPLGRNNVKSFIYTLERDYSHIRVEILNSKAEIVKTVVAGKDKWLIFVDNKAFGETLKKEVEDYNKEFSTKKSVEFITAGYKSEPATIKEVDALIHDEKQTVDVLIATSVLDNGINFNDIKLRNLVIIADTETQFLQMLGRKRFDGEEVNVYIFRQNKDYFVKRQRQVQRKMNIIDKYFSNIKTYLESYASNCALSGYDLNKVEKQQITYYHDCLMKALLNGKVSISTIQSAFFVYGGILHLNLLSYRQLDILNQYYLSIIEEFERNSSDAFLEEQFKWMGKDSNDLVESKKREFEKSKQIVIDAITDLIEANQKERKVKLLEDGYNEEEAEAVAENEKYFISVEKITDLKNQYKQDFLNILKKGEQEKNYKTSYNTIYKKSDSMTKQCMDFLNKYCEIPYKLVKKEKKYILEYTK